MPKKASFPIIWILTLVLTGVSFACQTVVGRYTPTATVLPPSSTTTSSPFPTETLLPASPTLTLTPDVTATLTPPAMPLSLQIEVFEALWQAVNTDYLYPDFNGVHWAAIQVEYRQKIMAGLNRDEFYLAMDEMLGLLGDEHSFFLSPEDVKEEEASYAGENDYVGIGVYTSPVIERRQVNIIVVFPGSPAQEAGLKSRDNILEVDGQPIMDKDGIRTYLLRGPVGSPVTVLVQTPGEQPRQVTIVRRRIQGAMPAPYTLLTSPGGKRVAYILLPSFADETIDDQVGEALRELTSQAPLDGVVLDNRQNTGGADVVARGVLGYFIQGDLGYFTNRRGEKRWLSVNGEDIQGSLKIPLVVLVGKNTASFGEIFSGVLQDSNRAILIGEQTPGNVELLYRYDFPDGSRAWIARSAFRPKNNPEQDWEGAGITPDQVIAESWDLYTLETDPVVQAALEELDRQ